MKNARFFYTDGDKARGDSHIPFTLNTTTGQMESIGRVVSKGLRGALPDNYICPECDGRLVSNWCNDRVDYFSHKAKADCTGMTALHLMAQQIIAEEKCCYIPEAIAFCGSEVEVIVPEKRGVRYESSELEYHIYKEGKRRTADVVLKKGSSQLVVEIAVTSACSFRKIQHYKDARIVAIEYDLSKVRRDITEENLRTLLLTSNRSLVTRWLSMPALEDAQKRLNLAESEKNRREVLERRKKEKAEFLKNHVKVELSEREWVAPYYSPTYENDDEFYGGRLIAEGHWRTHKWVHKSLADDFRAKQESKRTQKREEEEWESEFNDMRDDWLQSGH